LGSFLPFAAPRTDVCFREIRTRPLPSKNAPFWKGVPVAKVMFELRKKFKLARTREGRASQFVGLCGSRRINRIV